MALSLMCYSQSITLIKDVNQSSLGSSSYPNGAILNGLLFFGANDGVKGEELWVSDGTEEGTILFHDIFEGAASSNPHEFTLLNNVLLFVANDGAHGQELWRSDGTVVGTKIVKDIIPGVANSQIKNLTVDNNRVFFKSDYQDVTTLYVTDGTPTGTQILKSFNNNTIQSLADKMTIINHVLFFRADDGAEAGELWRSNGTVAGTIKVSEVDPLLVSTKSFGVHNNLLLFSRVSDSTLYQTDGTDVGTIPFQNLFLKYCEDIVGFESNLYFTQTVPDLDGDAINEAIVKLWKYDGLQATVIFEAIYLNILGVSNNGIFLTIADGATAKRSLWISGGTSGTTVAVAEIIGDVGLTTPLDAEALGDKLIFVTHNLMQGNDVWVSDGTETGTFRIADTNPDGIGYIDAESFIADEDRIFFWADNQTTGMEPWVTDGTVEGTGIIKNIQSQNAGSSPSYFIQLGEEVLFVAETDLHGKELWKTDGSSSGTVMIKDIHPTASSVPSELMAYKNDIYFAANNGVSGFELWKTNASEAGTTMVLDLLPGAGSSFPTNLVVFKEHLYFWASNENTYGLWKSDGTVGGTTFVVAATSPFSGNLTVLNNYFIYFNASGLWRSDGTQTGTTLVKSFVDFQSTSLALMNNKVFFVGKDAMGLELWMTDGTLANTVRVRDVQNGMGSSNPQYLTYAHNRIYFSADDGVNGSELWQSDGTLAGTTMVKDIFLGSESSGILWIKNLKDELFFNADDGVNGNELWKCASIAVGADFFFDFSSDENSSFEFPGNAGVTGDKLFMNLVNDETSIGISDGTLAGTQRLEVSDRFIEAPSADQVYNFHNLYLFNGYTDDIGDELWSFDYRDEQTVSFIDPGDKVYGDPDFKLEATSSNGLPLKFEAHPRGIIKITELDASILKPGEVKIILIQEGNALIKSATAQHTILIDKASQTINFSPITDKVLGAPDFIFIATSTSGLPLSFTTTSDKLVITKTQAEIIKAGRATIVAQQNGNMYYKAALSKEQSFCINPAKPLINYNENVWPILLTATQAVGNQWYLNDDVIVDASASTYTPSVTGKYTLVVTVDDCKSEPSEEVDIIFLGNESNMDASLILSPNPTEEDLKISSVTLAQASGTLFNATGKKITTFNFRKEEILNVSTLTSGLYFIRLIDSTGKVCWNKFIKR